MSMQTAQGRTDPLKTGKKERNYRVQKLISLLFALLVVGGYLAIPLLSGGNVNVIGDWIGHVNQIVGGVSGSAADATAAADTAAAVSGDGNLGSILQYTVGFIAVLGVIASSMLLVYNISKNVFVRFFKPEGQEEENPAFLKQYAAPISVLIVGMAVLLAFGTGNSVGKEIAEEIWDQLLTVILVILIAMVAIEIVRLAVEQCVNRESLLRRCICYVYIALVDFVMGIVLGVFSALDVKQILFSLLTIFVPTTESKLYTKIKDGMEEALNKAVDQAGQASGETGTKKKKQDGFTKFSARKIQFRK